MAAPSRMNIVLYGGSGKAHNAYVLVNVADDPSPDATAMASVSKDYRLANGTPLICIDENTFENTITKERLTLDPC